jgi:hypothetical protein
LQLQQNKWNYEKEYGQTSVTGNRRPNVRKNATSNLNVDEKLTVFTMTLTEAGSYII